MPRFKDGNRVGGIDQLVAEQLVSAIGVFLCPGMISDVITTGRKQTLKLDDLWVVLRRDQIHSIKRSLMMAMPNRQVGDAPGKSGQSAGANPQSVAARML